MYTAAVVRPVLHLQTLTFAHPRVPEQAGPVLKFLESTDFKLDDVEVYNTYVKPYVQSEFFKQVGFGPRLQLAFSYHATAKNYIMYRP